MIRIVVDSTADLPHALYREYDITVVPVLAQFGADHARDAAYRVETAGREGELKEAAEAFAELERLMERLQPELRAMISAA